VIRAALERQPVRVHVVHLHNPMLTRPEFVELLATRFGLSEAATRSKAVMLTELEALLSARRRADETSVLVVDEAQSLPLELLEEIRLLVNIETNDEKLLSVVIAGQPELADRLNQQSLRQLKQRVALRCSLRALTSQETAGYIAGRIKAAGGIGSQLFTREAVALIHEMARGLPRTISVIADNALLGGFAAGQKPVGSALVRDVCRDFDISGDAGAEPVTPALVAPAAPSAPAAADTPAPARLLRPDTNVVAPPLERRTIPVAAEEPPAAPRRRKRRFPFLFGTRTAD
jgi:general secretion pathway protein A